MADANIFIPNAFAIEVAVPNLIPKNDVRILFVFNVPSAIEKFGSASPFYHVLFISTTAVGAHKFVRFSLL